jgi:hypothetical protein
MTYIIISPRGFSNETVLRRAATRAQAQTAASIINDDVNAWAEIVPARDPRVRRALAEESRYGEAIEALTEDDVAGHRPEYIGDDGARWLGRESL